MTGARAKLGALGEAAAEAHLLALGFRLVARNHRCPRGEVDLIMEQGDLLVFVEVRTRASDAFGAPSETISAGKRRRIVAAARDFLARRRGPDRELRFDVLSVVDAPGAPHIEHIPAAFDADDR